MGPTGGSLWILLTHDQQKPGGGDEKGGKTGTKAVSKEATKGLICSPGPYLGPRTLES